jgi:tetratricopeptide (TPR) repeat protein
MKKIVLGSLAIALGFASQLNAQQIKFPAKSPAAMVKQSVGISDISVEYNRPSASGRVVFGDVVPFDAMWRTGANSATKITFGSEMKIDGKAVPAGSYSLFTIPGKTEWTIILNKVANMSGTYGYTDKEDLMRFKVTPVQKAEKTETFTIDFANIKLNQTTVQLMWDNTIVSFDIAADYDSELTKSIETAMSKDARPYYQAASYYYENKKDLNKALEWINKAVEMNPSAYWVMMTKANIQLDLKDKKGAIATAEQVKKIKDVDGAYVKMANDLIEKAKK